MGVLQALQGLEQELLVFAAFWFVVGLLDEFAVDLLYLWLKLTGQARTVRLPAEFAVQPLTGPVAMLVPAWQEAPVIAAMLAHTLRAWPQAGLRLYVGCYRNDPATVAAAMAGAAGDARVRVVVHAAAGPTTKADCLNRLYRALSADEARGAFSYRAVMLHDAEDMVHPAALAAIDRALAAADFVQLPVRPEPQADSPWIAGHYGDEFAEAHGKGLVVRGAVGAGIPAAGVGCGFAREALGELALRRAGEGGGAGPFAAECLTEDYELGLIMSQGGRRSAFLRLRDDAGRLVATRSFFPGELAAAVRQKTRWIHGIAFQSWDRMGWSSRPVDIWMALRDRRGPLTALVLFAAYALLAVDAVLLASQALGGPGPLPSSPAVRLLVLISFAGFGWRLILRAAFTTREYGPLEGLQSVLRMPVANIIAIMAGRRAFAAYFRSLRGERVVWDKTAHSRHPAQVASVPVRAAP